MTEHMVDHDEGSQVICTLELRFRSESEATKVHRSVELDNEGYLESEVCGEVIRAKITAESLKSALHTLDDFMSCVSVAEKVVSRKR